jgi:hypothetical protein
MRLSDIRCAKCGLSYQEEPKPAPPPVLKGRSGAATGKATPPARPAVKVPPSPPSGALPGFGEVDPDDGIPF